MPSPFRTELRARSVDPSARRWIFVPYDQLTDQLGPLSRESPEELGIVVVESPAKGHRRPYHRQKLALVLANLRHFALEQASRGVAVRHVVSPGGYARGLRLFLAELPPGARPFDTGARLRVMEPAERELREDLAPLVRDGALEVLPHEGWLTSPEDFDAGAGRPPWRMDAFYRRVRSRTGILMEDGSPVGGRFSFDGENREPWNGDPPAAVPPDFDPDPVTAEVLDLVARVFPDHPGKLVPEALPSTRADADTLWAWARSACLPHFGPHEDAMSTASRTLFHTRISGLVNLLRLTPARVVGEALALDVPLAGKEGFVRQILGWREFVRHVHRATDGFRELPGRAEAASGDAGSGTVPDRGGHAAPSFLGAGHPLPPTFWGATPSGLNCLDQVVESVWEEGYSHHITRLMILSNLATLLDVDPRELTDWFWVAYTDAFDWVVEPNVLGMGTFAVGELMTTKPYVSGTPYIRKMSDYCDGCALDPDRTCPVSELYWAFLERHRDRLHGNRRMALPLASASRRSEGRRAADARVAREVQRALAAGERVTAARVRAARDAS
jgi:deoxyribodipyrimidine photolyase-related protein